MAAFVHSPLNTHYAASKAGVWAMCNSLRLEVKHLGVGVGSFHPTFFKTPMMYALVDNPCSMLVWNNHQGIWKFAELEEVVGSLIYTLENRRDMVTVPRQNAFIAGASGFLRPFIEKIGFDRKRVVKAVQLSEATAAKIKD
jgi:NAD(P)-dependent dehydrogenase (short-subunit alcohol dehydrogenase family)